MQFLTRQGRTLGFRLLGAREKPLLVLAHPLGMNQSVWDELLPFLLPEFCVLSWDLPGHGASSPWSNGETTLNAENLAQDLLALTEHAGAEQFHFIGTSIGGVIGQQLLTRHSESLLSATLTNTGAVIGTPDGWATRAGAVRTHSLSTMAEDIVARWFGSEACRHQPALLSGWQHCLNQVDDESYAVLCEMLGAADYRQQLQRLPPSVPLLLIAGSDDVATPPQSLQQLAQSSNAAAPKVLQHIGHVPSVEAPELLSELVLHHIRK
ncbi:alpha/beta fold hydrolase [Vibrio sp. ABG19]|uniref:alpha/beta fold hydrolase n=1 Tax=Vibrio sp. ABG19 TaxID=2817385 RepID=UPI00249DD1D7|nr:alpha/beta fold hydrolase [Vibrio sp. ABG19]WGY48462.1 alpha/beta fold hydrolase [Vibrio sp. ABG19]